MRQYELVMFIVSMILSLFKFDFKIEDINNLNL